MEIRLEMFFRYVVVMIQNPKLYDVPPHVRADVCPLLQIPSKSGLQFQRLFLQFCHYLTRLLVPVRLYASDDPEFSPTSTRVPILSP